MNKKKRRSERGETRSVTARRARKRTPRQGVKSTSPGTPSKHKIRRPAKKDKGGRPTKYEDRFVKQAERMALIGLPLKDMAYIWRVDPDTVTNWQKTNPAFSDAIKRGDAKKRRSVLTAIFINATVKGNVAAQIFLSKNWLGMRDNQDLNISAGGTEDDGRVIIEVVHTGKRPDPAPAPAGAKVEPVTIPK